MSFLSVPFHPAAAIGVEIPFQLREQLVEPAVEPPELAPLEWSSCYEPPSTSLREETPEPDEHSKSAFFSFRHQDICFGRDGGRCHVKLFQDDGVSKLHFTLQFNEYKSWMLNVHGKHLHLNGIQLGRSAICALHPERVNVINLPGRTEIRIYILQTRNESRVCPTLPYKGTASRYYKLDTYAKLTNGAVHVMEVATGRHCVAFKVGKRFERVQSMIVQKFLGVNRPRHELVSCVLDMDEETSSIIEPFYGQECLSPDAIPNRLGGRLLQQLSVMFQLLHDHGMHCDSIKLDDIIVQDEREMTVVLTGISRLLTNQPAFHGKIALVDREKGLKNLAYLVILAVQGSEQGRSPLPGVFCDPILWELLTLLQTTPKTMSSPGALCSYIQTLGCGEFEQPFATVRLTLATFVRFDHCPKTGAMLLCAKDVALLFERHARGKKNIGHEDLETIGRVRRRAGIMIRRGVRNGDDFVDEDATLELDMVLTLLRGGLGDSQSLREQLEGKHSESPIRIETKFSVPCIRDTGLVNATQMQKRTGHAIKLSLPTNSSQIQDVRGRAETAGVYVHYDLLPKRRRLRFDTVPTTRHTSRLAQQFGAVDPREYVVFDTESCASSRLMTMHRGSFRARWGFQAGSCASMGKISGSLSLEESRSICDKYQFIQTRQAIEHFVTSRSKSLPTRLDEPEPVWIEDPSGSDTDIEVWKSEDPFKFKRRTHRKPPKSLSTQADDD